jgi:hypothetical protein
MEQTENLDYVWIRKVHLVESQSCLKIVADRERFLVH